MENMHTDVGVLSVKCKKPIGKFLKVGETAKLFALYALPVEDFSVVTVMKSS